MAYWAANVKLSDVVALTSVHERHEVWMHTDVHRFEQSFKGESYITEIILKV